MRERENRAQTEVSVVRGQNEYGRGQEEDLSETPAKDIRKGRKKLIAFVNELLNATSDGTASCLQYWLLLIRFVRCTR